MKLIKTDYFMIPEKIIYQFLIDNNFSVKENKKNFRINSIFENDSKYKLWISKEKNGIWQDYKAHKKGDFINFVKEYMGMKTYGEAKMYLLKNYFFTSKTLPSYSRKNKIYKNIKELSIPIEFEKFNSEKHIEYKDYLLSRNIDYKNLNLFVDTKRKMIVFPIYEYGVLVYYVARSINPKSFLRYKNAETDGTGYIYGLDNIHSGSTVFIFEGIFDALLVDGGVALLSANNVTEETIEKILIKNPYKIYIVMDNDKAGIEASDKLEKILYNKISNLYRFNWHNITEKDLSEYKAKNRNVNIKTMIKQNSDRVDTKYMIRKIMEENNDEG